jgi:hypothetical protein
VPLALAVFVRVSRMRVKWADAYFNVCQMSGRWLGSREIMQDVMYLKSSLNVSGNGPGSVGSVALQHTQKAQAAGQKETK